MLKECGITTEWGMQVDEDVEKGKRMLNNLASGAIPKEAEMDIYQKHLMVCVIQKISIFI